MTLVINASPREEEPFLLEISIQSLVDPIQQCIAVVKLLEQTGLVGSDQHLEEMGSNSQIHRPTTRGNGLCQQRKARNKRYTIIIYMYSVYS